MVGWKGLTKHQAATSTTTIEENSETEVSEILSLMDADSLAYGCVILGLDVPEQKKGNISLLKYILR